MVYLYKCGWFVYRKQSEIWSIRPCELNIYIYIFLKFVEISANIYIYVLAVNTLRTIGSIHSTSLIMCWCAWFAVIFGSYIFTNAWCVWKLIIQSRKTKAFMIRWWWPNNMFFYTPNAGRMRLYLFFLTFVESCIYICCVHNIVLVYKWWILFVNMNIREIWFYIWLALENTCFVVLRCCWYLYGYPKMLNMLYLYRIRDLFIKYIIITSI